LSSPGGCGYLVHQIEAKAAGPAKGYDTKVQSNLECMYVWLAEGPVLGDNF